MQDTSALEYSLAATVCLEPKRVLQLRQIVSVEDFSISACAMVFDAADRPDSRTEHLQRPQRPEEGHAAACQHRAQRTSWTAGRCSWRWPCSAGNRQRRYGVHYLGGNRPCAEILRR